MKFFLQGGLELIDSPRNKKNRELIVERRPNLHKWNLVNFHHNLDQ